MAIKPIPVEGLRRRFEENKFKKRNKYDTLMPVFIGRERAEEALDFGLGMKDGSFHIFAVGPEGIGKRSTILHLLEERAKDESTPEDWCYVYNFQNSNNPISLNLPSGQGNELKKALDHFVRESRLRIIRSFESEEYGRLFQSILDEESDMKRRELKFLQNIAEKYSYQITETPFGITFLPVIDGQVVNESQLGKLGKPIRNFLDQGRKKLTEEGAMLSQRIHGIERLSIKKQAELNQKIISLTIEPLIEELKHQFSNFEKVVQYIGEIQKDMVSNAAQIKAEIGEQGQENILQRLITGDHELNSIFGKYIINVFVSHKNPGAPVVTETLPTVPHLIGSYEFRPQLGGGMTSDFSLIRAGALQQANGGYLVLDAFEVLKQPYAWEVLKSMLKNHCIQIEDFGERLPFSLPTPKLRPEPIPLTAKVILVGDPTIYYLLSANDPDFLELFKVKADFDFESKTTEDNIDRFSAFVRNYTKNELNSEIEPGAIARLVEEASRLAEHQDKISLNYRQLTDIISEAKYLSLKHGTKIAESDIKLAIEKRTFRANLLEEKIQEAISENTLFIDTDGAKIGQVNGLSVLTLGDYRFGKPSRITAVTFVGKEGVVNIERQTQLSGPIHGKAVLILANYLGLKYAQEVPLALSATLTFEQEYSGVEGDSATISELCALLSSLSGLPIRQDLAITGSVNQLGDIQPVGGVNEKIEGFFSVCKSKKLTGNQGVIIPAANMKHLMLKEEVLVAAKDGHFSIYPIEKVDEAIEILTGHPASEVHKCVLDNLKKYARNWQNFTSPKKDNNPS